MSTQASTQILLEIADIYNWIRDNHPEINQMDVLKAMVDRDVGKLRKIKADLEK